VIRALVKVPEAAHNQTVPDALQFNLLGRLCIEIVRTEKQDDNQ
jgi:hypothetical protein